MRLALRLLTTSNYRCVLSTDDSGWDDANAVRRGLLPSFDLFKHLSSNFFCKLGLEQVFLDPANVAIVDSTPHYLQPLSLLLPLPELLDQAYDV